MVWMACWDCKKADAANRASMLNYAPSTAPVPTPDGGEVVGQFTTLAIGFAVFQVFTVDYVEADVRKAAVWNTGPPNSVRHAIRLIWPHRLRAGDVTWPRRPSRTTALTVWSIGTRRGAA